MRFADLLKSQVAPAKQFVGTLLTFDPGETTGYIVLDCVVGCDPRVVEHGQMASNPVENGIDLITAAIIKFQPTKIVYEDYKVYSWMSEQHSWASLHTPQLIGAIRTLAHQNKIPTANHMAQHAKQFVTDDKLRQWGYYWKGMKHARDATRHALFYLVSTHPKLVAKAT